METSDRQRGGQIDWHSQTCYLPSWSTVRAYNFAQHITIQYGFNPFMPKMHFCSYLCHIPKLQHISDPKTCPDWLCNRCNRKNNDILKLGAVHILRNAERGEGGQLKRYQCVFHLYKSIRISTKSVT